MADPGEGPGRGGGGGLPLLFLDQTEVRGAEKKFFWRPGSPILEDLDPLLRLRLC